MQIDIDFSLLRRILAHLDQLLAELHAEAAASEDPDSFGILDEIESVTGLALVACQNYLLARTRARHKATAYRCGPVGPAGVHVAEAINAGANYWKHHPEWPSDETQFSALALGTVSVLRSLGVWNTDYKASSLMFALVGAGGLSARLLDPLALWREALDPGGFIPR